MARSLEGLLLGEVEHRLGGDNVCLDDGRGEVVVDVGVLDTAVVLL